MYEWNFYCPQNSISQSKMKTNLYKLLGAAMICLLGVVNFSNAATLPQQQNLCASRCGARYNRSLSCQCNDKCGKFQNCCADYFDVCEDSCKGRCASRFNSSYSCHCDNSCKKFKNCCNDYKELCEPKINENLCAGRCGTRYDRSLPCQCNDLCGKFGNCCGDYFEVCEASCTDSCGQFVNGSSCRCDYNCDETGTCCNDFATVCKEKSTCNGNCNVTRSNCECNQWCVKNGTCCTDYMQTCKGYTAWSEDKCAEESQMKCPEGFDSPPLIVVSLDGFQNDYIFRNITPNLSKLAHCGVTAPYLQSVYPTMTFPNHYSIVTGLYPESHGIIGNKIYDPDLNETFRLGGKESYNPHWWKGEPIWLTAHKHGLKSASFFWPGSDVNITRYPDYYRKYDNRVTDEARVLQVLKWLDLPKSERPSVTTMYSSIVDKEGHAYGPSNNPGINAAIAYVDRSVGMLMDGLKQRNLHNCVNLVVISDHGMSPMSCDRINYMEEVGVNMSQVFYKSGAAGRVGRGKDRVHSPNYDKEHVLDLLQCRKKDLNFDAFDKTHTLPKRLHYSNSKRIEDIILVLKNEWLVGGKTGSYSACNGGNHGWDSKYASMNALFVAHGVGFKRNFTSQIPFENIELYNLMTDLLRITPAPNNGTKGSLYHLMSQGKNLPIPSTGFTANVLNSTYEYSGDYSDCGICKEDMKVQTELVKQKDDMEQHFPFGIPHNYIAGNFCLLQQKKYVTAYDNHKKMPLYTSFLLNEVRRNFTEEKDCLIPDKRVGTRLCFNETHAGNLSRTFAYHPVLTSRNYNNDALLSSNVVPVYKPFVVVWEYMSNELVEWVESYNQIHVTVGPVFDYNYDGRWDNEDVLQRHGKFTSEGQPIPTHMFIVALRCVHPNTTLRKCRRNALEDFDVISFIIPNYNTTPCYSDEDPAAVWIPRLVSEHFARIKDVELITGLHFFTKWSSNKNRLSALRAKIRTPELDGTWMKKFRRP